MPGAQAPGNHDIIVAADPVPAGIGTESLAAAFTSCGREPGTAERRV
jgi:hypothetical protein